MSEATVEQLLRQSCDALIAGDIFTGMQNLANEALNDAMQLANGISVFPTASGYDIASHVEENGEHRYRVVFHTNQGEIVTLSTWRQIEGIWKVTSIKVEGREPPAAV
jgi:hypothetical protein